MELTDYYKLPKLRIAVSEEVAKVLQEYNLLANENSWSKSRYKLGRRALPIKLLLKNEEAAIKVLKAKPSFLTSGGVYVKLPAEMNADLAYICGLICGDGNLFKSKKGDYLITVHNIETKLLDKSIEIFEKNFDYSTKIKQGHHCFKIEVRSEVIHSFLNKIMEIESGRKKNIKIPSKLKKEKKLVMAFIAGFFDAEGNVALKKNNMTCQISLSQKQKGILEEIQRELEGEEIPTRLTKFKGGCWCLYGNKTSLMPFLERVPFVHPKKREKLETAVRNQAIWQNRKAVSDAAKNPTIYSLSSTV